MDSERIRANLNLYAVLQNLEELVQLDPEMARLTAKWQVAIQFAVYKGPICHLQFANGQCRHGVGAHPNAQIKLFFRSCKHLNDMFDGKANPIPLKGFGRLGFLKKDFTQLTERLAFYLKPQTTAPDAEYLKISTIMTMNTAMYATKELAQWESTSKKIASHIPSGILQMEVQPNGPYGHITFNGDSITVAKRAAEIPSAVMTFKDLPTANALLSGKLDAFLAVAEGRVMLKGQLPMIDSVGLILDRVEKYLK